MALLRPDGSEMPAVNAGSVSLSYDGDRRAAYLLLDGRTPSIRRVNYDIDRQLKALAGCLNRVFRTFGGTLTYVLKVKQNMT